MDFNGKIAISQASARGSFAYMQCHEFLAPKTLYFYIEIGKKYKDESQKKSMKIKENSLRIKFTINPTTIGE